MSWSTRVVLKSSVLVLAAIAVAGGCTTASETVALRIDGMACPNCAKHIEEELEAVPGVKSASVDFDSRTALVRLDPERPASVGELNAAVEHWKKEHFAAEEDPECLDPQRRAEIKRGGS